MYAEVNDNNIRKIMDKWPATWLTIERSATKEEGTLRISAVIKLRGAVNIDARISDIFFILFIYVWSFVATFL